jgi:Mrp family chromosome partitioning ATPase
LSLAFVASIVRGSAAPGEPPLAATPPARLDVPPMERAPPPPPEADPAVAVQYSNPVVEPPPPEPVRHASEPVPVIGLNPLAAMPAGLTAAEVTESLSGGQTQLARRLADAAALMAFWATEASQASASRRFGIMSFGCSAGDTSAATVAMARALSRTGKRTVIVDLCRSGSWLEALLGTPAGSGIADLVSGAAEFTKVMARDTRSPVHLLRYGQDRSEWAQGLVEQNIESVLQALQNTYDMLIVHGGEVVDETPELMRRCHAALVLAPPARGNDAAVAIGALSTAALRDVKYVMIEERATSTVQAA